MVIDFKPEAAEVLESDIHDVDAMTLQRFITADTLTKIRTFCRDVPNLFGARPNGFLPYDFEEDLFASAHSAQSLLNATLEMLRLSKEEGAQEKLDLSPFGIEISPVSGEWKEYLQSRDDLMSKAKDAFDLDGESERRLLRDGGYHGLDVCDGIVSVTFSCDIEGEYYTNMLERLVDTDRALSDVRGIAAHFDYEYVSIDVDGNEERVEEGEYDIFRLTGAFGFYPESDKGVKLALQSIADGLFTLHLIDVRTISANGGQEGRSIATGLSSLWWCALDALRVGRLGACAVCGRPFITNNERGKKRKYCSEACRQWNKIHPGEKRRPDTRRKRPEQDLSEQDEPSRRRNMK